MTEALQLVTFVEVKESYTLGNSIDCKYVLNGTFEGSARDWIGLYKVGWRSCDNYENYVWAQPPSRKDADDVTEHRERMVTFTADSLPKDSREFYQFCYVSEEKQVCGVSTPFQLTTFLDELVEIQDPDDPNTMVIKTKAQYLEEQLSAAKKDCLELQKESQMLQEELEAERASKGKLITQLQVVPQLKEEVERERHEKELLRSELKELHEGLQAERKCNEHLHEQLRVMRDTLQTDRKEFEEGLNFQSNESEMLVEDGETTVKSTVKDAGIYNESKDAGQAAAEDTKQPSLTERITGSVLKHLKRASDWFAEDFEDDETAAAAAATGPPEPTDKVGESLKTCPICNNAFDPGAPEDQITAHVESHGGQVCPICYMQFDRDYPEDNVTAHVNRCLDSA